MLGQAYLTVPVKSTGSWGMIASLDLSVTRSTLVMSRLSIRIVPSFISRRRNRARIMEDLPLPVLPQIPTWCAGKQFSYLIKLQTYKPVVPKVICISLLDSYNYYFRKCLYIFYSYLHDLFSNTAWIIMSFQFYKVIFRSISYHFNKAFKTF